MTVFSAPSIDITARCTQAAAFRRLATEQARDHLQIPIQKPVACFPEGHDELSATAALSLRAGRQKFRVCVGLLRGCQQMCSRGLAPIISDSARLGVGEKQGYEALNRNVATIEAQCAERTGRW